MPMQKIDIATLEAARGVDGGEARAAPRVGSGGVHRCVSGSMRARSGSTLERHLRRRFIAPAFATFVLVLVAGAGRAQDAAWVESMPPARKDHAMVCDPIRHRVLVFGGEGSGRLRGDLDAFSLSGPPHWQRLASEETGPGPRRFPRMVYDPVDDAVLVYGGVSNVVMGDVWRMRLAEPSSWELIEAAGTPPSPRLRAGVVLDPVRHRLLVFGGGGAGDPADLYGLSLDATPTWTALPDAGTSPATASGQIAFHDPVRDRIVTTALYFNGGTVWADVWALDLSPIGAWMSLGGVPGDIQSLNVQPAVAYDSDLDRLVVDYGEWRYGGGAFSVLWETQLGGPLAFHAISGLYRWGHAMCFDPIDRHVLAFGGTQNEGGGAVPDLLALFRGPSYSTWGRLTPEGAIPAEWRGHTTLYDPESRAVIAFGGRTPSRDLDHGPGDEIDRSASGTDIWLPLDGLGYLDGGRELHVAGLDAPRRRMLVFGGNASYFGDVRKDTWAFDLDGESGWSEVLATSPPPARTSAMSYMDDAQERFVVFGGKSPYPYRCLTLDTVWTLACAEPPAWQVVLPEGTPPPASCNGLAIFDPVNARALVFTGTGPGGTLGGPWELRLDGTPRWTLLTPEGTSPPAGVYAGDYDPHRRRMLLCASPDSTRCWELSLEGPLRWRRLITTGVPAPINQPHALVYDRGADRLLMVGGGGTRGTWALMPNPSVVSTPPRVEPPTAFAVRVLSNPGRDLSLALTLPSSRRVEIDIFDTMGRRAARGEPGMLPAGVNRLAVPQVATLGAGLYFVRVRAGDAQAIVRHVRVR